ncbi:CPBP family intramembrane glutamic endopeptidase [Burkholderia contaminans]|uniref:CPBP family intramembrane glutamic endopeptidase n=1 Tax=Burkholderia contaminans TaxID=488447 RepID=UPI002415C100|nr:CPBP family intramembrane glutamic endopeptidase [Burkholderia contaminans]WFN15390.1 CPBP family intramembrane metalloprotease [Burkholderia contaminans]
MKTKSHFARDFIDLARLGRTDWRSLTLTILIFTLLIFAATFGALLLPIPGMQVFRNLYLHHFSLNIAIQNFLTAAGGPVGVAGFWVTCKFVLRRPFASLISVDLRFSIKRFLLGAGLYLAAYMVSLVAMYIYAGLRFDIWSSPIGHFLFPKTNQNVNPILRILLALILALGVSFFAFGEELYMRGWMTQTLGQYIRAPAIVVIIVSVSFALLHTQYKWPVRFEMFLVALGYSALSLRDRRLELAVGAHSMNNIWAGLKSIIYTGQQHVDFPISLPDLIVFDFIKIALPFGMMYIFLQVTNGWSKPNPINLSGSPRELTGI